MTEDDRLYLQFLQNNIARMNTNSVQAKGWCIAIVSALLAIFAQTNNELFIWICLIPVILFCILDALYLQQEHKFVGMYNDFVKGNDTKPTLYEMSLKSYEKGTKGFFKALRSWSVWMVYLPLLFILILIRVLSKNRKIIKEILETQNTLAFVKQDSFPAFGHINILTITIIFISILAFSILFAVLMSKNLNESKCEKSKIDLCCTIFTTIVTPVLTFLSVILVVCTLQLQAKDSKQNNYNEEFRVLFGEMKSFIESLSVEIKYNKYSENPIELKKLEVIDELAYYLKCGKKSRQLYVETLPKDVIIPSETNWFNANIGDFYIENGNYYQVLERPENECKYFESINKRFRNIFKPIFELLINKDNDNRETHKHLFAAYMNKNCFEAYLTTRWEKQDIPDKDVLYELVELSY
ncbi:MAG: hypothetical protein SPL22_11975 [Treponema sp.]|uniref:hypothetical protein n=1 Tax=Treponema sp. TaxID=166 RepID=UPI002A912EBD|nr:hypothetical protein [Treponema sp.]MDY6398431.1 hypothetical protein [Treponema sp.]